MKQNNFYSLLLAGVITLGGCMISSCTEDESNESTSNRIIFSIDDQGFSEGKVHTRGAKVNSISSFGVSASVYGAASSYTSAGCGSYFYNQEATVGVPLAYLWPTSDYRISFFAYYPYGNSAFIIQSAANALGSPTYSYTVPSAIASHLDIMTTQRTNMACTPTTVALSFAHRCADIRFNVYNRGSSSLTVHSIGVYGVKYSGTFNDDNNPKWTLNASVNSISSNPFLLTAGTVVAGDETVDITGTTNHFIMLPQTVAAGTQMIDVDATVNGVRNHYYHTLESSFTILAGKIYNIRLEMGEETLIVDMTSDIQDWSEEIKNLSIESVGNGNTWTQPSITDGEDMGIENWEEEEE